MDNVLYLSCNVKKPKATGKLSKKNRTNVALIAFDAVHHEVPSLKYSYRFLPSRIRNQVSEKLYLGQWQKRICSQCNLTAQTEPVQRKSFVFTVRTGNNGFRTNRISISLAKWTWWNKNSGVKLLQNIFVLNTSIEGLFYCKPGLCNCYTFFILL